MATVAVDSLTTTDGQYGCRTWSGIYELIRLNARWQITRVNITPSACQVTGNTGNTGNTGPGTPATRATPGTPGTPGAADALR